MIRPEFYCRSIPDVAVALLTLAALSATSALAGPAIGQFELKDLEAEPGRVELQILNAHSSGEPRRKVVDEGGGDFEFDDNSIEKQRHALELESALTNYLRMRVGIEFEKERLDDIEDPAFANDYGDLKLSEIGFEVVTIFKHVPTAGGFGFGALAELEVPLEDGELNTILFGPIVQAQFGRWGAIGNLMFIYHFGSGEFEDGVLERDKKWDLGYATQLSYQASKNWMLTLEGYGTVDRIGNTGTPGEAVEIFGDHNQHRAGPIIYYSFETDGLGSPTHRVVDSNPDNTHYDSESEVEVSIGAGVLFGLNENTPDHTLKWSIEVEY